MKTAAWHQKIIRFLCVSLILLFGLSACDGPLTATSPPTQAVVRIGLSPELQPLAPALNACARAHPDIAMFVEETPAAAMDFSSIAFGLRIGTPSASTTLTSTQTASEEPGFLAPLAQEELAVIVNQANPITHLSLTDLQSYFSGRLSGWTRSSDLVKTVQVWVYPTGNPLRSLFDTVVLNGSQVTSQAMTAPGPAEMLEAVGKDPSAIGFVPRAWLNGKVRAVSLDPDLEVALRLPVLALARKEPQGAARVLLGCLQQGEGQTLIKDRYLPGDQE